MGEPTVIEAINAEIATCLDRGHYVKGSPRHKAALAVLAKVAGLIEAGKRIDAAIMAWRTSGKPDLGELNAAQGELIVALARVGDAQ